MYINTKYVFFSWMQLVLMSVGLIFSLTAAAAAAVLSGVSRYPLNKTCHYIKQKIRIISVSHIWFPSFFDIAKQSFPVMKYLCNSLKCFCNINFFLFGEAKDCIKWKSLRKTSSGSLCLQTIHTAFLKVKCPTLSWWLQYLVLGDRTQVLLTILSFFFSSSFY